MISKRLEEAISTNHPKRVVARGELNRIFNEGRYWERALAGELTMELKTNTHRTRPTLSLPYCTHNQIYRYYDGDGNKIAVVHQMLLPSGQIGGSGRPEPKAIWVDDELLYIEAPD